jgi:hypothetical protein
MAAPRLAAATAVLACLFALATLASGNTEGKLHIHMRNLPAYHITGIVTKFNLFFSETFMFVVAPPR